MSGSMTNMQAAQAAAQQNTMAGNAIRRASVAMTTRIFSSTFAPASNSGLLNISPRNVGLIRGFHVQITGQVQNTGAVAIRPTVMNLANMISSVSFVDLANYTRIQTTGWHLSLIDAIKKRRPYGSALVTDDPRGYGSNMQLFVIPASIAPGATGAFECWYYIPLAYADDDFRGAVYAAVVNATMNLQLTINQALCVPFGTDSVSAVFVGAAAGAASAVMTTCTVNIWQDFLDQLPMSPQGAVLPLQDLANVYLLQNTNLTGLSAGQDFPLPYANFRDFLSTTVIFDNGGTMNPGTDINYWAMQSANFTNIFNVPPHLVGLWTRNMLGVDVPVGMYLFDHRKKPVTTQQYGNMELILNPSIVNANAVVLVGYEAMARVNSLIPAGSLPGG